jgi:FtsP/CotA-like multicopper oxidase with cupredoxin domain
VPHCFNDTNMHTHGLWVSPAGNSDNVLISINPSVTFEYEYNIPSDHPAGTFWYHSHLHGSTALQVSSGMAGALIIHGDRPPRRQSGGSLYGGDIDTLLRLANGRPFRDRVLLFQQIAYACRDASGAIKLNPDQTWRCDPGDVGGVEGYDQLTPASWDASGRQTGINGEIVPTLTGAVAGRVERWRLIHGGVRDTIKLRLRKLQPTAVARANVAAYRAVSRSEKATFIDQNCTGEPLAVFGLATDGLTRSALHERTGTFLQPGYREDLLVLLPDPGIYCLIDGEVNPDQTVNTQPHGRELLGYVEVMSGPGSAPVGSPPQQIVAALVASAQSNLPADMRQEIASALENDRSLAAFVRHPTVAEAEVTGHQSLGFRIFDADPGPPPPRPAFEIGELGQDFAGNLVLNNSAPYDPLRIDRTLRLGGVDEWLLTSFVANHPFHIHVNPFQIVDILDAQGNDLSGPGDSNDNEYAGFKGAWKDTLIIRQGVRFRVRTRYERYIGEYVLHCHILDHEDQGMMQNVRVAIPSGRGGLTAAHH